MNELKKFKIEQLLSALKFKAQSSDFIQKKAFIIIIASIRLVISTIELDNIKLYGNNLENSILVYVLCLLNSQKSRQLLEQALLRDNFTASEIIEMAEEIISFTNSPKVNQSILYESQQIVLFLLRKDNKFKNLSDRKTLDIETQIVLAFSWS